MNSSASESDTSFTGRVGGRPKKCLRSKTLSWSDHVDKITYASDGESLLVEDRVSEKKPLTEENDKNKKGANVKRLRGTPMEGFQIMTLDDLNDQKTLVSREEEDVSWEDDTDDQQNYHDSDSKPLVENGQSTDSQPAVIYSSCTDTSDIDSNLLPKRPVPAPRTSKSASCINSNSDKPVGTSSGPVINNNQPKFAPSVATKPVTKSNRDSDTVLKLGAQCIETEKIKSHEGILPKSGIVQENKNEPDDTCKKIQISRDEQSTENCNEAPPNVQNPIAAAAMKDGAHKQPKAFYAANRRNIINKNSVETNIDEVTPLMSEDINAEINTPPDSVSNQTGPPLQEVNMQNLPPNQFMSMRAPYPDMIDDGSMRRFPLRPLFPQHYHPNVHMQRPPMGPYPPRFIPPNWRPLTPDQMNVAQGGSPYGWQNDSRDSPMSINGHIQRFPTGMPQMPTTNGQPLQIPGQPLNFSTGSSPVPGDVEPRYFTFEGREYPEGHPMLYPHYGIGAPSTMTGITGVSMAPTMATIGPSIMQDANPHLTLSIIFLLLGNWIFGPVALVFSLMSRSSIQKGEYPKAAMRGRISLILNIIGMVVTVLFVILIASMSFIGTF